MTTTPSAPPSVTADSKSAVTVRFFAGAADIAGTRLVRVPVSDSVTIRAVFREVLRLFPGLSEMEGRLLFAANAEYAGYDHVLQPGDELCLIPPVSGGES